MPATASKKSGSSASAAGNDTMRNACQACLDALLARSPALKFACLGTVDGRLYACASSDSNAVAQRISAMASSLLALSESFSKDALRSHCTHSTISTEHGAIVTVRIPCSHRTHVVSVGADATENMAMTLRHALDVSEQLAAIIDRRA